MESAGLPSRNVYNVRMSDLPLILASKSPRRAQLLREAGLNFIQVDPPFDDPAHPESDDTSSPQLIAMELAGRKAASMLDSDAYQQEPQAVVLAADTVVVFPDGRIVGTPTDASQARSMLEHFRDQRHDVITAVALFHPQRGSVTSFADTATVIIGDIPDAEIDRYLATDAWRDKAGGYNLFERQEAGWPVTVEGDPTTVVGLPLRQVLRCLRDWGIEPDLPGHATSASSDKVAATESAE